MSEPTHGPWESTPTYPEGDFIVYSKSAAGRVPSECKRIAYVYEKDDARLIAAAPAYKYLWEQISVDARESVLSDSPEWVIAALPSKAMTKDEAERMLDLAERELRAAYRRQRDVMDGLRYINALVAECEAHEQSARLMLRAISSTDEPKP